MKKIMIGAVALVAVVAVTLVLLFSLGVIGKQDQVDWLGFTKIDELKQCIADMDLAVYSVETDYAYLKDVSVLGRTAEVEYYFTGETVEKISAWFMLFEPPAEFYENQSEDEYVEYSFTEEDKVTIQSRFDALKAQLETRFGCTLEQYDLVPAREGVQIEDREELFFDGSLIREYSVRDAQGVLWILRYQASYSMANAVLMKMVNEQGYEGFIPSVDLS